MKLWLACLLGLAVQSFATQVPVDDSEWSWQKDAQSSSSGGIDASSSRETQEKLAAPQVHEDANIEVVDPPTELRTVESVVDEILVSNRQGRNVEGFDQLYADPDVKNALQLGNDTIARSYIKEKLCTLGLMNCENVEGRRPYYSPHRGIYPQDIIYAQPVTIKPVGRPLPAIPVKRPYGSTRPGPPPGFAPSAPPSPGFISSGPPPEVIYGAGAAPHPPSFASYPAYKKPGPPASFPQKPIFDVGAGAFEFDGAAQFIDKKQLALRPSLPSTDPVQQHVHHHYHHTEGGSAGSLGAGVIGAGAIGQSASSIGSYGGGGYGNIGTSYDVANSGVLGAGFQEFDDYKKAFKVKGNGNGGVGLTGSSASANGYAERYPVYEKPTRENAFGKADGGIKAGKYFGAGSYVSPNAVQASSSSYLTSGSSSANYYNSFDNLGNDFSAGYNADCVCVPYDQCPGEHAGRKDDLFLAIDPRNLNKNIDAENGDGLAAAENANGTSATVRLGKSGFEAADSVVRMEKDAQAVEESQTSGRRRREAAVDEAASIEGRKKSNGEGRLDASDLDSSKLNLKPTWGISFGLPETGGQYPINPYGDNALVNPYRGYGSAGQGINLGLVSVNPLLAVQFTKDEYGEKVVKPFVNLHVTPSRNIVQKLGHLLSHKKQALFDNNYGPGYATNYYPPSSPIEIHEQPYISKPPYHPPHRPATYSPPYYQYRPQYHRDGDDDYDYNYDYDYDERYRGVARSDDNKRTTVADDEKDRTVPTEGTSGKVSFFPNRRKRDATTQLESSGHRLPNDTIGRRYIGGNAPRVCGPGYVCCAKRQQINKPGAGQCGIRYTQGINGRIKTPSYVDGDAEFGEYPWQVAILKKDPTESVYVCGGTLVSARHILTAAHCVKTYAPRDLRVRLGEWDVNHDVEFYPYIERDVANVFVHPEFYAGTLYNDIAVLRIDHEVDFHKNPHISPACLPDKRVDYTRSRCWTTGWGKDAFGDFGKYQNILKEVDVPVVSNQVCEQQMRRTRLGPSFNLHPGFICAGGEEGKDACKGDGGGPMVCERNGRWQLAGVVSWGIGCGQPGVPGVYARVSHYLDWLQQIISRY